MNRITLFLLVVFLYCNVINAQSVPQGFKYQTVVRNSSGGTINNQIVRLRFSFYSGSSSGVLQWQEEQLITTNSFGGVFTTIGNGVSTGAGLQGNFSTIPWASFAFFLKVELDTTGGTSLVAMGTSQLFSVPYAFYSSNTLTAVNLGMIDMHDAYLAGIVSQRVLKYNGLYWVPGIDLHHDTVNFSYNSYSSHTTDTTHNVFISTAPDTVLFAYHTDSSLFSIGSELSNVSYQSAYADTAVYAFNFAPAGWTVNGNNITSSSNYLGSSDAANFILGTNNQQRVKADNLNNISIGNTLAPASLSQIGLNGIFATGTFGTFLPLTSGAGTRFIWFPSRAAFRAGGVTGNLWDTANIGNYSAAAGFNTKAGHYSFCSGYGCTTGDFTIAIGHKCGATATLFSAGSTLGSAVTGVALGDSCTTASVRSVTIGRGNTTSASTCIALGRNNKCVGVVSTALGQNCVSNGNYSTAIGSNATTGFGVLGSFVFADDSVSTVFTNNTIRSFKARASNGIYFYTNASCSMGAYIYGGSGSWSSVSDRRKKENFKDLKNEWVLQKLMQVKITSWNYKTQEKNIRHIGPMAQDFYQAFHLGEGRKSISTLDADGIILSGIQAIDGRLSKLNNIHSMDELKDDMKELNGFEDLEERISALEEKVKSTNLRNKK